jgi:hypothetical protein
MEFWHKRSDLYVGEEVEVIKRGICLGRKGEVVCIHAPGKHDGNNPSFSVLISGLPGSYMFRREDLRKT